MTVTVRMSVNIGGVEGAPEVSYRKRDVVNIESAQPGPVARPGIRKEKREDVIKLCQLMGSTHADKMPFYLS